MTPATSTAQDLFRRLIALEALCDPASVPGEAGEGRAIRVCEKLRVSLIKFAGIAGYRTLAGRALSMAKADAPSLEPVQVRQDGSLEGFDRICARQNIDAADIVLIHLLCLLVTFIGERQTLAIVRDQWPADPPHQTQPKTEKPS